MQPFSTSVSFRAFQVSACGSGTTCCPVISTVFPLEARERGRKWGSIAAHRLLATRSIGVLEQERNMSEQHAAGPRDRERIDAQNDDDIRWWAKELGVTGV